MPIKIIRKRFTSYSTEGQLYLSGTEFQCYTLEPRLFQGYGKPYCTPEGIYLYRVCDSAHFQRKVICVLNVPGFTAIEVHPGNFPKDTHGCTLVGQIQGADFIGHSDAAFDALLEKLTPPDKCYGTIQYVNEP
jgi:hypothetical protein